MGGPCWLGHRYRARYDFKPPRPESISLGWGSATDFVRMMDAVTVKTYVRDVCERCGHAIARDGEGRVPSSTTEASQVPGRP